MDQNEFDDTSSNSSNLDEEFIDPSIRSIDQLLWFALGDKGTPNADQETMDETTEKTSTIEADLAKLLPERFVVERVLGRGTFGIVYLAKDTRLQRDVAIKVLRPEWSHHPSTKSRFIKESRAASRLNHSAIVRVLEADENDSIAWQVCDVVRGNSLTPIIRQGPLPARVAVKITHRIAEAVACAHEHGVVHRDIKPDNILLDCEDRETISNANAFLTDFGLAKFLEDQLEESRQGVIVGTMLYMAPEQFESGRDIDYRKCDVYSLGIVLFECLCGNTPFISSSTLSQRIAKSREPAPSVRRFSPGIERDLERICAKALERDVSLRYPSAALLAADLDAYLRGQPISARRQGPFEQFVRLLRRNPVLASLLAFIILGLSAFATFLQHSNNVISNQQSELHNVNKQLKERVEVADHLTESSNALRRASDLARERFSDLAWRSEMREAYRCWEDGDLVGAKKQLLALGDTHPDETQKRLEWRLLACQLDSVYREKKVTDGTIEHIQEVPNSVDGITLVSTDSYFQVHDAGRLKEQNSYKSKENGLNALSVTSDATVLFGGRTSWNLSQSRLSEYDWKKGTLESCSLFFPTTLETIVTAEFGRFIFAGARNEDLVLLDRETGQKATFPSRLRNDAVTVIESQKQFQYVKNDNTIVSIRYSPWYSQTDVVLNGEAYIRQMASIDTKALLIVAVTESSSLLVIDTVSWQFVAQLRSPSTGTSVDCLATSRDGRYVAAGAGSGEVSVWDLSNEPWWQKQDHKQEERVQSPGVIVDGSRRNLPSVQATSFVVSDDPLASVCFTHGKLCCGTTNGHLIVVASIDPELKSVNEKEHSPPSVAGGFVWRPSLPAKLDAFLMSDPEGGLFRVTPGDGEEWCDFPNDSEGRTFHVGRTLTSDWRAGKVVKAGNRPNSINARYESSSDGKHIAWLNSNNQIELLSGKDVRVLEYPFSEPMELIGLSPDGTKAVMGAAHYVHYVVTLSDKPQIIREFKTKGRCLAVDWHEHEDKIVLVGDIESVDEYDFGKNELRTLCKTFHGSYAVRYSKDFKKVYSGHTNGTMREIDLETNDVRASAVHRNEIMGFCIDREERLGFSVDNTNCVAVWEVATGELVGYLIPQKRERSRKLNLRQGIRLTEDESFLGCVLNGAHGPLWRKWDVRDSHPERARE